jgi:hypothetical protein
MSYFHYFSRFEVLSRRKPDIGALPVAVEGTVQAAVSAMRPGPTNEEAVKMAPSVISPTPKSPNSLQTDKIDSEILKEMSKWEYVKTKNHKVAFTLISFIPTIRQPQ